MSEVDELVAAGRHAEAADQLCQRGDPESLRRALGIYERLWNFRRAAELALRLGDRPKALALYLEARDAAGAGAVSAQIECASADERRTAAEVYEQRRMWTEAARLREALGENERAAADFGQAQLPLEQARLFEVLGKQREAGQVYEQALVMPEQAPVDSARAHLALGRILEGFLRHEEAARHLQAALPDALSGPLAQRLLPLPLAQLGLRDGARDALTRARRADPNLPDDLDAAVRRLASELRVGQLGQASGGEGEAGRWLMGRYRLDHLLGSGGSGRVYRGFDAVRGIAVAVKIFSPLVDATGEGATEARGRAAWTQFLREAKVLGRLRHPHVVELYEVDEGGGFLVMELMVGGTLEARLKPSLPLTEVPRVLDDVLAGLEVAHQRGIVHRDLKPANIFFSAAGRAKLGDFGVAHLLDLGQTQTGGFIGSLAYMSPEQITGARLTVAADFYALGVTLYLMLTGRLPFAGPDFAMQHLAEYPPPPSVASPGLPLALDPILAKLLAKEPAARYQSAGELTADLAVIEWGAPPPLDLARPRSRTEPPRADPPTNQRPAAERYLDEAPLTVTGAPPRLFSARDAVLGRGVVLERFAGDGELRIDEATFARLQALARAGGRGVQRVLRIDRAAGLVVYDRPEGQPLSPVRLPDPEALQLLASLAHALAALHGAGITHGAVVAERIVREGFGYTLIVHGLPDRGEAPAADLAAALALVGADAPEVTDLPGLAAYLARLEAAARAADAVTAHLESLRAEAVARGQAERAEPLLAARARELGRR